MLRKLVLVKKGYRDMRAVYLDEKLLMRDMGSYYLLLKYLGFEIVEKESVSQKQSDAPEFDWDPDDDYKWKPPTDLGTYEDQLASFLSRKRKERIAALRKELRELHDMEDAAVAE